MVSIISAYLTYQGKNVELSPSPGHPYDGVYVEFYAGGFSGIKNFDVIAIFNGKKIGETEVSGPPAMYHVNIAASGSLPLVPGTYDLVIQVRDASTGQLLASKSFPVEVYGKPYYVQQIINEENKITEFRNLVGEALSLHTIDRNDEAAQQKISEAISVIRSIYDDLAKIVTKYGTSKDREILDEIGSLINSIVSYVSNYKSVPYGNIVDMNSFLNKLDNDYLAKLRSLMNELANQMYSEWKSEIEQRKSIGAPAPSKPVIKVISVSVPSQAQKTLTVTMDLENEGGATFEGYIEAWFTDYSVKPLAKNLVKVPPQSKTSVSLTVPVPFTGGTHTLVVELTDINGNPIFTKEYQVTVVKPSVPSAKIPVAPSKPVRIVKVRVTQPKEPGSEAMLGIYVANSSNAEFDGTIVIKSSWWRAGVITSRSIVVPPMSTKVLNLSVPTPAKSGEYQYVVELIPKGSKTPIDERVVTIIVPSMPPIAGGAPLKPAPTPITPPKKTPAPPTTPTPAPAPAPAKPPATVAKKVTKVAPPKKRTVLESILVALGLAGAIAATIYEYTKGG